MPWALKVFRAHLGFYDSIVAAPSQKAAAAAWGSGPSLFQHKTATETKDADAATAALAQPGVVLSRPFGSRGDFKEKPDLPKAPRLSAARKRELSKQQKASTSKKRAAEKREKKEVDKRARAELAELDTQEKEIKRRRAVIRKKAKKR
jgi:hypothetical protein